LLPPIGEFFASSVFLEWDRGGDGPQLAFSNKKPNDDRPLTFNVNNGPGIGPQYLLLKTEDTTLLGRVAGRYCEVFPGLSPEDRVSEVFLGCQFEHRLSQCNKVSSTVEYACGPTDFASRILRTQAAWELLLDPAETRSLHTAVLESL
jgi:hypothetical protein